jgi:hypothetical protein
MLRAAIPVTGRGGALVCEISRLPHCLDSRLKMAVRSDLRDGDTFTRMKIPCLPRLEAASTRSPVVERRFGSHLQRRRVGRQSST